MTRVSTTSSSPAHPMRHPRRRDFRSYAAFALAADDAWVSRQAFAQLCARTRRSVRALTTDEAGARELQRRCDEFPRRWRAVMLPRVARVKPGPVCVVDTETTGLSKQDRVVEFAAVTYSAAGELEREYSALWQSSRPCHPRAVAVHGITNAELRRDGVPVAQGLAEAQQQLDAVWARGGTVVAHNLAFDRRVLAQTDGGLRWHGPVFCTMLAARKVPVPERGPSARNEALLRHLELPPPKGRAHRALVDCKMTGAIFWEGRRRAWW